MNWLELTARERDAVVAEKVMGKRICTTYYSGQSEPHKHLGVKIDSIEEIPNYSTDIAAAWLVVERMKDVRTFHLTRLEDDYECLFQGFGDDKPDGYAVEPTAPEAICLAALRAMGVEG